MKIVLLAQPKSKMFPGVRWLRPPQPRSHSCESLQAISPGLQGVGGGLGSHYHHVSLTKTAGAGVQVLIQTGEASSCVGLHRA